MANTLYISEFAGGPNAGTPSQVFPGQPSLADQAITFGASVASNAFGPRTRLVMLIADTACSILFGAQGVTPVATTVNLRLPANVPVIFAVFPGQKVAAITAAA